MYFHANFHNKFSKHINVYLHYVCQKINFIFLNNHNTYFVHAYLEAIPSCNKNILFYLLLSFYFD